MFVCLKRRRRLLKIRQGHEKKNQATRVLVNQKPKTKNVTLRHLKKGGEKKEQEKEQEIQKNQFTSIVILTITIPISTLNIQIHHFKITFMCPMSIAGVPFDSAGRFRAYYCAPLVCVPAVSGSVAVWRHNKPKTKTQKNIWYVYTNAELQEITGVYTCRLK